MEPISYGPTPYTSIPMEPTATDFHLWNICHLEP